MRCRHLFASARRCVYRGVIRRAQDRLAARVSGPWTREKLAYIEKSASAFMKAMAPKRKAGKWSELASLDFLAGPGRGIDRDSACSSWSAPSRGIWGMS